MNKKDEQNLFKVKNRPKNIQSISIKKRSLKFIAKNGL